MNRDQIRALLGGYATGSLTEAEKTVLFEAALDDQELFDELAREQALKEVIDQPGARERLIASLQPARAEARGEKTAWPKRPWPWAAAAVAAMVMITIFVLRPAHRAEVARLEPPRIAPPVQSAPPAVPVPSPSAVPKRAAPIAKRPAKGVIAPQASARKDTAIAESSSGAAPSPPPAVPSAQPRPQQRSLGSLRALAPGFLPKPFGFHYAMDWTGDIAVTVDADGYLTILAGQNDSLEPFYPLGPTHAGSTTRLPVPAGIDAIVIEFFASPPNPGVDSGSMPITRTKDTSGALSDPTPSPDSKLLLRIAK